MYEEDLHQVVGWRAENLQEGFYSSWIRGQGVPAGLPEKQKPYLTFK